MTNIERAAEVILGRTAPAAARALASAGLLAPDPVEPREFSDGSLRWGNCTTFGVLVGLATMTPQGFVTTTPEGLRHEAAALLSAATYAEEHTAVSLKSFPS